MRTRTPALQLSYLYFHSHKCIQSSHSLQNVTPSFSILSPILIHDAKIQASATKQATIQIPSFSSSDVVLSNKAFQLINDLFKQIILLFLSLKLPLQLAVIVFVLLLPIINSTHPSKLSVA